MREVDRTFLPARPAVFDHFRECRTRTQQHIVRMARLRQLVSPLFFWKRRKP
jgi:hypothetical protein